jgi:hypothetical protein
MASRLSKWLYGYGGAAPDLQSWTAVIVRAEKKKYRVHPRKRLPSISDNDAFAPRGPGYDTNRRPPAPSCRTGSMRILDKALLELMSKTQKRCYR